jgi:hypothetical protein
MGSGKYHGENLRNEALVKQRAAGNVKSPNKEPPRRSREKSKGSPHRDSGRREESQVHRSSKRSREPARRSAERDRKPRRSTARESDRGRPRQREPHHSKSGSRGRRNRSRSRDRRPKYHSRPRRCLDSASVCQIMASHPTEKDRTGDEAILAFMLKYTPA